MRKKLVTVIVGLSLLVSLGGLAQAADLTGEDVLDKVKNSIDADSAKLVMRMELYNKAGSNRERKLKAWTKEKKREEALIRFTFPASIEGTGFLSRKKKNSSEEEMYLYMPALGSVRKIAGSQRHGSFVGTDFSYNDLSILGGGNYKEDYKAEIKQESSEQYLLRIVPTDEDIEYKYGKMWVSKSNWVPTKIKFYDQQGKLYKKLMNDKIKQVDDYWTPHKITLKNIKQGSRTVLYLQKVIYDKRFNPRLFTIRHLRRY